MMLEPRTTAHAEALFAVLADPRLYAFLDEAAPVSVDALRQKLARSESRRSPDGSQQWLNWIVRDDAGELAGYVQATIDANGDTNIAYLIGSDFQGLGLGRQAVAQLLRIVAAEFGATRFYIVAERANERSLRLARGLGFTDASFDVCLRRGIACSDVLLSMLPAGVPA